MKLRYIKSCKKQLEQLINETNNQCENISKNELDKQGEKESFQLPLFIEFSIKLSPIVSKLFEEIHLSIISGEYIKYGSEATQKEIDYCNKRLEYITEIYSDPKIHTDISIIFSRSFFLPIKLVLEHYTYFLQEIEEKIKGVSGEYLFKDLPDSNKHIEGLSSNSLFQEGVNEAVKFIKYNIRLAILDYNLSMDNSKLKELLIIHDRLQEEKKDNIISGILKTKSAFLIKKILNRANSSNCRYYTIGSKTHATNESYFNTTSFTKLPKIVKINHLDSIISDNDRDQEIDRIKRDRDQEKTISFSDYHLLIKQLKSYSKNNLEHVESVWEEFRDKYKYLKTQNCLFNKRAYSTSRHYLYNNLFSYYLDRDNNLKIEDIETRLKKIEFFQEEEKIYNYFPYQKLCFYLTKKLKTEIINRDIKESKRYLDYFKTNLTTLKERYKWCIENDFIPFQPQHKECITAFIEKGITHHAFIASSFMLPVDYKEVEENIKILEKDYSKFTMRIDSLEDWNKDRESLSEIKENIQKSDKKHIEILGIFSAIVLFASTNIQLFDKITSIKQALQFMMVFGYVMILFIVMVWIISRDVSKAVSKINWFIIGLISAGATFSIYLLTVDFP